MSPKKSSKKSYQGMLFEESYLMRTYQQLTSVPAIALTELVANAWDAGASLVNIHINKTNKKNAEEIIVIEDNGIGMTEEEFQKRWRTLGYNRISHQGSKVVFPEMKKNSHRIAYGRNGIGRHGLLCFNDSYIVTSKSLKTKEEFSYQVSLGSNENLLIFEKIETDNNSITAHGTRLTVTVQRNKIGKKDILQLLSRKFLYDPQFTIAVNDDVASLEDLKNRLETIPIRFNGFSLEMIILRAFGNKDPGIAFWQQGRLVGQPSWQLGSEPIADKRTFTGKNYSVIIKTDSLTNYIKEDWSGFRPEKTEELQPLFNTIETHFVEYCRKINTENYDRTKKEFEKEFSEKLHNLSSLGKIEFDEALQEVLTAYPNAPKATIKAVLTTVVQLGKKRGGVELLQQIINMEGSEIEKLNNILNEWTVQEIYVVLDEIDRRIRIIDTIAKLSKDKNTPELAILHQLVTEARWVFGPEFDSPEYTSNQWLRTVAKQLFKIDPETLDSTIVNKRPDLVALANSTISLTGTLHSDPRYGDTSLNDHVLLIELKKGGSELKRDDLTQIEGYVDEIHGMSINKNMTIMAFLVGYEIGTNLSESKRCQDQAHVYIRTYAHLVDSARHRLFQLRKTLSNHYDNLPESKLYQGLLPGL